MKQGLMLSIVIPCFNDGQYLPEAVASALAVLEQVQGELIIVNDGSVDALTLEIIREIEQQGIQVIHQENKGLGAARNSGIRSSKGKFILPLDSDNRLKPEFVSEAFRLLSSEDGIDIIYPDLNYFGNKSGLQLPGEFDAEALVLENFIDACAVYRKQLWAQNDGYDESMRLGWEDWDFWLRAASRGARFWHYPGIGLDYRVREGSLIQTTKLHQKELVQYIFSKPELQMAALARQKHYEAVIAKRVYHSAEYRAGRVLLYPFRQIQSWFR